MLLLIKRIVKLSSRFIILFGNFNLIISTKEKNMNPVTLKLKFLTLYSIFVRVSASALF